MTQRYQSSPGNGLFGTSIRPQATPDYSGLIDSISNAFTTTREGVLKRAMLQQQAELQRQTAKREDAQLQIAQQHLALQQQEAAQKEQEYANGLHDKGYKEVDPNQPQIGDDGKPLQVQKVGQRAFIIDPNNTEQARRGKMVDALTDPKLKPEDRQLLKESPEAFKQYIVSRYGSASTKPTTEEKVNEAVAIAKATRGIPTYGELHPRQASPAKEDDKKAAYVLTRAAQLQKPEPNPMTGLPGQPIDRATAEAQAAEEFDRAHGVAPQIVKPKTKQVLVSYDANTSDADLWEKYKSAGLSSDQATAKVKARKK